MIKTKNKFIKLDQILDPIKKYSFEVEKLLEKSLSEYSNLVEKYNINIRNGKKIRSSLFFICSGLLGKISKESILVAASIELLHEATLIHDDIIDNSRFRRNLSTINSKHGSKVAVLLGDLLVNIAIKNLINLEKKEILEELTQAAEDMIYGEFLQLQSEGMIELSISNYLQVIEYKTARFMGVCSKLSAIINNCTIEEIERLYNCGLNLGIAFQIKDDILDLKSNRRILGKETFNDIQENKLTLPLILLHEKLNNEDKNKFEEVFQNNGKIDWLKNKIIEYNIFEDTQKIAEEYVKKALKYLDSYTDSEYKYILQKLGEFIIIREK